MKCTIKAGIALVLGIVWGGQAQAATNDDLCQDIEQRWSRYVISCRVRSLNIPSHEHLPSKNSPDAHLDKIGIKPQATVRGQSGGWKVQASHIEYARNSVRRYAWKQARYEYISSPGNKDGVSPEDMADMKSELEFDWKSFTLWLRPNEQLKATINKMVQSAKKFHQDNLARQGLEYDPEDPPGINYRPLEKQVLKHLSQRYKNVSGTWISLQMYSLGTTGVYKTIMEWLPALKNPPKGVSITLPNPSERDYMVQSTWTLIDDIKLCSNLEEMYNDDSGMTFAGCSLDLNRVGQAGR